MDARGNEYVTGYSLNNQTGFDYATVKYDAAGSEQWVKRYANGDDPRSLAVDALGNVYVTGERIGNRASYEYATIKFDGDVNELWVRRYNGPGNGFNKANSMVIASSCPVEVYLLRVVTGKQVLSHKLIVVK